MSTTTAPSFRCRFCESAECGFDEHQETGQLRASCECCGVAGRWSWSEAEAVESLNTVMPDSELLSLLGRLSAVRANSNSDPDRMGDGLDEIGSIVSQALSRLTRTPPAHLSKFFKSGADCCPACGCTAEVSHAAPPAASETKPAQRGGVALH